MGKETFEKLASGHCEAHVRRGNLFDNQLLMRLLHFVRNDKLDVFQRSRKVMESDKRWLRSL